MQHNGPIVFIEDDPDDQEIYAEIIKQLNPGNELKFLSNGEDALNYLYQTTEVPFLIFCDINMPYLNGIELRNKIVSDDYLRKKSIPFVFFTTSGIESVVKAAYELSVQGFFTKSGSFEEIKMTISNIISYWKKCKHPNVFRA